MQEQMAIGGVTYNGWTLFTNAEHSDIYSDRFAIKDDTGQVRNIQIDPEEIMTPLMFRQWVDIGLPFDDRGEIWTSESLNTAHYAYIVEKIRPQAGDYTSLDAPSSGLQHIFILAFGIVGFIAGYIIA